MGYGCLACCPPGPHSLFGWHPARDWWQAECTGPDCQPFPTWATCPQTSMVGACCSSCAEGKSCTGACEACGQVGGCACKARQLATAQMVGIGLIQSVAYESDAIEFDAAVDKLNVDLAVALKAALEKEPGGNQHWADLTMKWGAFYPAWKEWHATKPGGFLGTYQGESLDRFNAFRKAYNDLLELSKATGVPTSATPIDLRSNLDKSVDSATSGASGAIGSVVGTLTTVLLWTSVAGAVGLALYFGGPPLIAAGVKAIRK
jgi:hypothetical protein